MEFTEGLIPENAGRSCLLRLWEMRVDAMRRPFREHHHVPFEIVLFREGTGVYETLRGRYAIAPGDVFVFASNEVHCITEIAPGGLSYVNIHFEPRYLWGSRYDSLAAEHQTFCLGHAANFENRLPHDHPATGRIRALILDSRREMQEKRPEYALLVRNRIAEIAVLLIRELGYFDGTEADPLTKPRLTAVKTAIDYVLAHYPEPLTLGEIARAAQVTPNYLSALFHKTIGISLWEYVTEKRIDRALYLLGSESGMTVLDVALACGFNSTASFNKAFRQRTDTTPRDYRKLGKTVPEL